MNTLFSPSIAYLIVITAFLLFLTILTNDHSFVLRLLFVVFFLLSLAEFYFLPINAWALVVVGLTPVPYYIASFQTRLHLPFLLFSAFMLAVGTFFLFTTPTGAFAVNPTLASIVSVLAGLWLWLSLDIRQKADQSLQVDARTSMTGLTGVVLHDIEPHSVGFVEVDGDRWAARSNVFIPTGTKVRVLRRNGGLLTVTPVVIPSQSAK